MYNTGLPWPLIVLISIIASFAGGLLMGLIYSFLTVTLKANQNVTGLAMTTFGVGLTRFIMSKLGINAIRYLYALKFFRFPFSARTDALKYCGILAFLGIAVALVASYVLAKTRVGLHLRAVGENPGTADAAGINVTVYKYLSTCIGAGMVGLGGLYYVMDYTKGTWANDGTIEGLGWLAVALVIFTTWKPVNTIWGAYLFGVLYWMNYYLPGLTRYSQELFKMLPYLITIVVLIITSLRKKKENQPPASLGLSYFREER